MNLFDNCPSIIMGYNRQRNFISFIIIIILIIFSCFSISFINGQDTSEDESNHSSPSSSSSSESVSSEDRSSYGERLAESSYTFTSTFAREPKEETNIYSSGINAILNSDGFLNQMDKFSGSDTKYRPQGPVEMAVHSKKTVEVIPVKFEDGNDGEPQVIEISPYEVPVSIVFKTQTNKLNVNQEHKSEPAEEPKEINSEEEPHRVIHNVYRPVIQEVTEVVQPFRKVLQKVEPVIEEMKTIISKAAPQDGSIVQQQQQQQHHQQQQQQQQQQRQQFRTQGPFGFGDNAKIHRFTEYQPMAYGSEIVGKVEPAPSPLLPSRILNHENKSILHRFGSESNNDLQNLAESNSSSSPSLSSGTNNSVLEPTEFNDKEANLHYNDIIKQYIDNLLSKKQQQQQQQKSTKSSSSLPINANSIKMMNIPMKSMMPMKLSNDVDNNNKENNQNNDDVAGKMRIMRPNTSFLQQQPSTQSARFIKTDGTIGKLKEFKRRSRSAYGGINNVAGPLRTYHYMNFKRFGDIAPTSIRIL
nr:transcription factor mef2A-like [Dermatophagoides farinae]